MGIIVKWTPRPDSNSARPAPEAIPASDDRDVLAFPRVKIAELRHVWEAMKAELTEQRDVPRPSVTAKTQVR
jgi:hypothetical protein